MITYQELVDHVSERGTGSDSDEARRAIEAVTGELARCLDPDSHERLRSRLPGALRDRIPAPRAEGVRASEEMARQVGERLGCPPERGLHLSRVVLAEIGRSEPELAGDLAPLLPRELARWMRDPAGAAGDADTGITGAPSRLNEDTLTAVLRRLPDWEGDSRSLTRSVELPADRMAPLLNRVDRDARRLDHSFSHDLTGSGVTFVLRTASVDAVTTRDVALAERIDQAVAEIGSGG